jgi:hypothetical protein
MTFPSARRSLTPPGPWCHLSREAVSEVVISAGLLTFDHTFRIGCHSEAKLCVVTCPTSLLSGQVDFHATRGLARRASCHNWSPGGGFVLERSLLGLGTFLRDRGSGCPQCVYCTVVTVHFPAIYFATAQRGSMDQSASDPFLGEEHRHQFKRKNTQAPCNLRGSPDLVVEIRALLFVSHCRVALLIVAYRQLSGDGFEVAKEATRAVVGAGGEIELRGG